MLGGAANSQAAAATAGELGVTPSPSGSRVASSWQRQGVLQMALPRIPLDVALYLMWHALHLSQTMLCSTQDMLLASCTVLATSRVDGTTVREFSCNSSKRTVLGAAAGDDEVLSSSAAAAQAPAPVLDAATITKYANEGMTCLGFLPKRAFRPTVPGITMERLKNL
jgi:hypothetical protein